MLLCCIVGSRRSRVFGATLGTKSEAYFNKLTCSILQQFNLLCNNTLHGLQVEKQWREVFSLSFITWIYLFVKQEMKCENIVKDKIEYNNSDLKNHWWTANSSKKKTVGLFHHHTEGPPFSYCPMISLGSFCRLSYHPMIIFSEEYLNHLAFVNSPPPHHRQFQSPRLRLTSQMLFTRLHPYTSI